jgi:hypothetical protein
MSVARQLLLGWASLTGRLYGEGPDAVGPADAYWPSDVAHHPAQCAMRIMGKLSLNRPARPEDRVPATGLPYEASPQPPLEEAVVTKGRRPRSELAMPATSGPRFETSPGPRER